MNRDLSWKKVLGRGILLLEVIVDDPPEFCRKNRCKYPKGPDQKLLAAVGCLLPTVAPSLLLDGAWRRT